MEEGPMPYHPHHVPLTKTCISETFGFLPQSDYSNNDNVNHRDQRSHSKAEISEFHLRRHQDKNHLKNKVIVEDNGDNYRIITSVIDPDEFDGENGLETGFPHQTSNQVTQISSEEARHSSNDEYKICAMVTKTDLKQYSEENNEKNYDHSLRKDLTTVGKTNDSPEEFTIITSLESPIRVCEDAKGDKDIDGSKVQLREDGNRESRGRISSWRQNQKIVSDAFHFLRDLDEMDGGVSILDMHDKLDDDTKVPEMYQSGEDLPGNRILKRGSAIDVQVNNDQYEDDIGNIPNTDQNRSDSIDETVSPNSTLSKCSKSSGSQSSMSETGSIEGLNGSSGVVKRQLKRNTVSKSQEEEGEDEENSSDDDTGVYRESYRKSTWLFVGDDISKRMPSLISEENSGISESGYTSMASIEGQQSGGDEVFTKDPASPLSQKFNHRRNDSTATTISEAEFRKEYHTLRKCYVQRSDSQQEYHRVSHKFYDGKQLELEVASSNINTVRDLQMPIMTGTLLKLSSSSILRSWKKRFFILRQDNCLYYYKTEQDKDPLGAIPLTGYVISRHGDLNKNCFKAEKYCSKIYHFMADSRETMTRWVGAMNEASKRGKERKDSWLDVTSINVQLPALDIRQPDCSGWLYKLGRSSRHWIKRYSVLKDACIYFYKTLSSTEARGVAHLHGYTLDFGLVGNKKYSFSLKPPEMEMRTFSFYTENETDKQRWTDAFQKSILKWVKVD
ncbi:hypothetical protein CHS0354_008576 [Potamilus streckersoni]|uniref:PH domain-containing protein n=1 Tax=Potamilus streckersoni TaxID=2493646 RepID=A0AAE0VXH7_9BIVA|nr:hypothetical protein CHS0354_008576 [Potamilus streckersoni]